MSHTFSTYETLALASLVLLLGYFLVKRISILKTFNIPEPVVGGFIVAIGLEDKSIYKIQWTASDKTKKVDSITITMTYTLNKSHRKSLYKEYSGVRIQNK